MKIFITGIAGFLGSHLANRMIDLGHEVSGNDNLIVGEEANLNKKINFFETDCNDLEGMSKIIKGNDIVYHCAATAHEGLSVFSPNVITKNIFQASISTITASIQNNVKRFIYCSSMARYGSQKTPFDEGMEPKPEDPYGVAKVAGENILKILSDLNGMEWNIAVPHNIIGPRQKYDDPFRNVVSIMLNRMLLDKAPIIFGDGNQKRCFSYIDDCIFCLEKMLDYPDVNQQIINIGPDEEFTTINEVAKICSNITGSNLEPIYRNDRPKEVKEAMCSADKARKILNYKTSTSLVTGIEKTFEYIKNRGAREFDYTKLNLEIKNSLTPRVWLDKEI